MHSAITPPLMSPKIRTTNNISDVTASNTAPSSIFAVTNFAATPLNYHTPDSAQPMILHPSFVLPMMACQTMVQDSAASDGASYNGTTCNGNTHHGAANHDATKLVLSKWHRL